ncbi:MAG: ABC transporter ATP-binding protein, partial [Phycisphaerales bacterium]
MISRRESSRGKYTEYKRQRPWAESWAKKATDEKSQRETRTKRSRGFFELYRSFWKFTSGRLDLSTRSGVFDGHRVFVYASLATLSLTTLIGLIVPASTKVALDYVLTNNPGPEGLPAQVKAFLGEPIDRIAILWWLGGAMVALSLLSVLIGTFGRWQMTRVTKRLQAHIRRIAFEHAVKLPLHRIHHYKSGGMASLLRDDAGLAGELLFSMVYNPWRAIVQLTGTLIVLAWVDWRMLVGAVMLVPVVWVTHKTWIGRIRPLYRDAKVVRQGVDATTTEAFGGMRVVRGFARERAESSRFTIGQHYMTRIEVLTWWWSRVLEVAWSVMIPAASAGVLIYGGSRVVKGELTIGDVMMFSTYLLMLLGPLETLTNTATAIQSNLAALDRVLDLLDESEEFG